MNIFLYLIIILLTFGILYCIINKQKQIKQLNLKIQQLNEAITSKYNADTIKFELQNEITKLESTKENLENQIKISEDFAKKQAENYYNTEIAKADNKIKISLENLYTSLEREGQNNQRMHLQNIQNMKKEYQQMREELTKEFSQEIIQKKQELNNLESAIGFLKSCVNAATAENERAKLESDKKNYYRITLSKEDIEEIAKIRSIEPYLRNKEVLNKVIWTSYYRTPTNDMCNRVVGTEQKTGIYKLTNLTNGMVYVGQAVSISERFIQHIKKGIGADNPGRNKLYPAMLETGAENFTFEVIEECLPEELNDKEKYWIDFYNGVEYGYNLRVG